MNAYIDNMRRYFDFNGRSSPSQYWSFARVIFGASLLIAVLDEFVLKTGRARTVIEGLALLHAIPSLALTARRLHDADRTGWAALLVAIPIVNLVTWIVVGRMKPTPGVNRFGPPVGAMASQQATGTPVARDAALNASTVDQLERLASLRASGAVDDAEYERLKADAMRGVGR